MEDLIPFLVFIVIALINLVKFVLEKGAKGGKPTAPGEEPPKKEPSSIEAFFENLAEKLEPKPVEPPDWPEERPRPDYVGEAARFEEDSYDPYDDEEAATAEIIPMPIMALEEIPPIEPAAIMKSSAAAAPNAFSVIKSARLPSMSISSGGGRANHSLRGRAELRKAIIANVIFNPPRAFDVKFENTITK